MKTRILSWILIISISVFSFISCDKDDKKDFVFSDSALKQTTWKGTELVTNGDQVIEESSVLIQFFTANKGQYILKEEGYETEVYDFKYVIEGKIMEIDGAVLNGKWTLLDFDKDKMVLESYSSYKVTLNLSKVH